MPDTDILLSASGVTKSYGPVVALRSVDLSVRRGELHALLGANGAGKSTLVKILSGVVAADAGEIEIDGVVKRLRSPREAMAAGIATVFQDPALLPDLTVAENIRLSGLSAATVREWLERVGLQDLDHSTLIRRLPLESLRMLDLAQAAARNPHVLLLDELTAALPIDQADRVFSLLADWTAEGRAAVFITHRLAEVMRYCDRATILRDGRDVERLDPKQVDEGQLIAAMLGAPVEAMAPASARPANATTGEPALEVRNVTSAGKITDISFTAHRGEILGIVALEGQGQDHLFSVLSGDRRPSSGEMLVGGQRCRFASPADAVSSGVVLVPGDRVISLLPNLPVRHNLALSLFTRLRRWLRLPTDETERVDDSIERLSIDMRAGSQVRRLSGGNQQKVAIGRWLVGGFRTLLCFDPTRGIDLETKREIYVLLRELAAAGAAIVLYTSELAEVSLVCDRVLIMHDGRIVAEQLASEAGESSMLAAAHGLEMPA